MKWESILTDRQIKIIGNAPVYRKLVNEINEKEEFKIDQFYYDASKNTLPHIDK